MSEHFFSSVSPTDVGTGESLDSAQHESSDVGPNLRSRDSERVEELVDLVRQQYGNPGVEKLLPVLEKVHLLSQMTDTNHEKITTILRRVNAISELQITTMAHEMQKGTVKEKEAFAYDVRPAAAMGMEVDVMSGADEQTALSQSMSRMQVSSATESVPTMDMDALDNTVEVIANDILQLSSCVEANRVQATRDKENIEKKIYDLKTTLSQNRRRLRTDGKLIWRISSYNGLFLSQRIANEADKLSITSPRFQTPSGHEFRLRAFLNGTGRGKNTHVSLFIQVCRTEFDDILTFPFNGVVTFSVLDQSQSQSQAPDRQKKQHRELRFKTNTSACFQKPTSEFNPENGLAQFISHSDLNAAANPSNPP